MTWSELRNRDYPTLLEQPARFWAKVAVEDAAAPHECWEWTGCLDSNGYGRAGKNRYAHRTAYELAWGPIPPGQAVCHHCDNPPCCRPSHLFVGTLGDNAKDMARKGRVRGGLNPGQAPVWTPSQKAHAAGTCMRGHDRKHTVYRKSGPRAGTPSYCRLCKASAP